MIEEKQLLLNEIAEKIEESQGFIITKYQEFDGTRAREFRNSMHEAGGEFEVVRKRIFIKAAKDKGYDFNIEALKGHVGIVFGREDMTSLAKKVVKYGEANNEAIALLGGQIEGELCTAEELVAIAKLPPIAELRASLLGVLQAAMSQTLAVFQSVLTSVIYCIEEQKKSKEE
ncbi:MAG: 50S ribosomal protein L10 [Chlamydiales bacterium]